MNDEMYDVSNGKLDLGADEKSTLRQVHHMWCAAGIYLDGLNADAKLS